MKCMNRKARSYQRIVMFDFDGTLFKSWEKTPEWWPDSTPYSFLIKPESLDEPCVPEVPSSNYWVGDAVQAAKAYQHDAGTYMVLVTGRVKVHKDRVKELLGQQGLKFHNYYFNPGTSAVSFKKKVLGNLLAAYNTVDKVEIWENENIDNYQNYMNEVSRALGRGADVSVHNIHVSPIPLTCNVKNFEVSAARVASRYHRSFRR